MSNSDVPGKSASEELINRHAARGVIMNCLNAIRLQAACLPPSSFLRQYLSSHPKWNNFQSILMVRSVSIRYLWASCTEYNSNGSELC